MGGFYRSATIRTPSSLNYYDIQGVLAEGACVGNFDGHVTLSIFMPSSRSFLVKDTREELDQIWDASVAA